MLFDGRSDSDIMHELALPQRTLTRYKHQIYQEYANQFRQEQMSNIGYYSAKLHYKLTRYQSALESRLDSCTEIKDATALVELAADLATATFELEMHRLEVLDDIKPLDNKMRPLITSSVDKDNDTSFKKTIRFVPENTSEAS